MSRPLWKMVSSGGTFEHSYATFFSESREFRSLLKDVNESAHVVIAFDSPELFLDVSLR